MFGRESGLIITQINAVTLMTNKFTHLISENFFFQGDKKNYSLPNHRIRQIPWRKFGTFAPLSKRITSLRLVCSFGAQQCKKNNVLIIYHKYRAFLLKGGSSRI